MIGLLMLCSFSVLLVVNWLLFSVWNLLVLYLVWVNLLMLKKLVFCSVELWLLLLFLVLVSGMVIFRCELFSLVGLKLSLVLKFGKLLVKILLLYLVVNIRIELGVCMYLVVRVGVVVIRLVRVVVIVVGVVSLMFIFNFFGGR